MKSMAAQSLTTQQICDTIYHQIPHALSLAHLEEYGVQASESQAQLLTEEVLSLNLFWVKLAMDAHLTELARDIIYEMFLRRVKENWTTDFHLEQTRQDDSFSEMVHRHKEYSVITESGGEPIALFTERAATMESDGVVPPGTRLQLVALLFDCVPVDAYGELLEDVTIREE